MSFNILAIDPGSTSTKVGVFYKNGLMKETISHDRDLIDSFENIFDQKDMRVSSIYAFLKSKGLSSVKFDAVVARGGLLKPIEGGVYLVSEAMLDDLRSGKYGVHAANLGGIIAHEFSVYFSCPAFIVDPPTIDEMDEVAKLTGFKDLTRKSKFHALNQRAAARKAAETLGKRYEEVNLIVAHMGGGVSIGAHKNGTVVDVNNALDGDGPYAVERTGSLPVGDLVRLIKDGIYTPDELLNIFSKKGGIYSYLGLTDMKKIESMIENGDRYARLIVDGFVYQIAKEIGSLACVLDGKVDGIVFTGGLAYSDYIIEKISNKVSFLAPIFVFPGEFEIETLIDGALRVLKGEEKAKDYV